MILVDTSAFYALIEPSDDFHTKAKEKLESLIENRNELITHNYLLAECYALFSRRLGFSVVRQFYRDVYQMCRVLWVSQSQHERSSKAYVHQKTLRYSFVDCVSFELMRANGIRRYFSFDNDFRHAGFEPA